MNTVPEVRIEKANFASPNPEGEYILYWMIANRRASWNYSLDRAVELAKTFNKPIIVLEALRSDYPWASDRLHQFILEGMADNAKDFKRSPVYYYPFIEKRKGEGKGLLKAFSKKACVIVTDNYPAFFLPNMVIAASKKINVLMEKIDSNGIMPMSASSEVFNSAYQFRRFLQKHLPSRLFEIPKARPFSGINLPELSGIHPEILARWPPVEPKILSQKNRDKTSMFPVDRTVTMVNERGGSTQARKILKRFIEDKMSFYAGNRNEPEKESASGLSPYLHFGHISAHQILHAVMKQEEWFFGNISDRCSGSKKGWWGMNASAEAFLDQLITWRELGFNMCFLKNDYDRFESLPAWAQKTLMIHAKDPRPYGYKLYEFDQSLTHDSLWNAAQRQLKREGRIHNYLRMLWGKKILHWSKSPLDALNIMIELNNKYAIDGRDPNSYSGIFWVLGRYDRPWGPERPVFGKIRFMTSKNTTRKYKVANYIKKYS